MRALMTMITAVFILTGTLQAATPDVNTQRFVPSPFHDGWFSLIDGAPGQSGFLTAGMTLHYQKRPAELRLGGEKAYRTILDDQLTADFSVAYGVTEWFDIALSVPVVLFQTGDGWSPEDDIPPAGMGDISVMPRFRVFSFNDGMFNLALLPVFTLPVGSRIDPVLGHSSFSFAPTAAFTFSAGRFSSGIDMFYRYVADQTIAGEELGAEFGFNAGVSGSVVKKTLAVTAELLFSTSAGDPFSSAATSMEVLGGVAWTAPFSMTVSCGGGTGVISGFGTPLFRVFCGVSHPFGLKQDDKTAVSEKIDSEHERAAKQGTDGATADRERKPSDTEKKSKKPVTAEKKEVPKEKKPKKAIPGKKQKKKTAQKSEKARRKIARPVDTDRDGIPDAADRCPKKPETRNRYRDKDGCPDKRPVKKPRKESGKRIGEAIMFVKNSANIRSRYTLPIEKIAVVLRSNYTLKLKIVGHRGSEERKGTALKRARAVKRYFIQQGIEVKRLTIVSRGASRKASTGDTDMDRRKNRRVLCYILQ